MSHTSVHWTQVGLSLKCNTFSHTPIIVVVTLFNRHASIMNPILVPNFFVPFNPYANIAFHFIHHPINTCNRFCPKQLSSPSVLESTIHFMNIFSFFTYLYVDFCLVWIKDHTINFMIWLELALRVKNHWNTIKKKECAWNPWEVFMHHGQKWIHYKFQVSSKL